MKGTPTAGIPRAPVLEMGESVGSPASGGRRVFLIHGMGRSTLSLLVMKWRLERMGHQVTLFGYMVTFQTLNKWINLIMT